MSPIALESIMPLFSADDFEKTVPQWIRKRKNFIKEKAFIISDQNLYYQTYRAHVLARWQSIFLLLVIIQALNSLLESMCFYRNIGLQSIRWASRQTFDNCWINCLYAHTTLMLRWKLSNYSTPSFSGHFHKMLFKRSKEVTSEELFATEIKMNPFALLTK